jgi:hypothetical protein
MAPFDHRRTHGPPEAPWLSTAATSSWPGCAERRARPTSPLWFDTTAKRYGIGAVRAANATPVRLDDFLGVSF